MIYLLKQGESYKVAETVEDGWEPCRFYANTDVMLSVFGLEFYNDSSYSDRVLTAIRDYVRTMYEDRQKLEFHLRQKNLAE